MLPNLLKLLVGITAVATAATSVHLLGAGFWSLLFFVLGAFLVIAAFVNRLHEIAVAIGRSVGVLSLLGLGLLLLAATVGGSFNVSDGVEIIVVGLFVLSCLGGGFFFVKFRKPGAD